jgi:glycosyltransferase involved in cell wall biosynthesis
MLCVGSPQAFYMQVAFPCHMLVSVIISTYGMERIQDTHLAIESLLKCIDEQTEILVVVDRNDQLSADLETRYGDKICMIINDTKGLSNARNLGVSKAKGEIVAFMDDDATACPGWVNSIRGAFQAKPEADATTGRIEPEWMQTGLDWLPKSLYWIVSCTYMDLPKDKKARSVIGTNMAFRKNKLQELGGFHQKLGAVQKWKKKDGKWVSKTGLVGEERDLCIKLLASGGQIVYSPAMMVKHKVYGFRLTMKNMLERCYWEGYSKGLIGKVYSNDVLELEQDYFFYLAKSLPGDARGLARLRQSATICLSIFAVGFGFGVFKIRGNAGLKPARDG